ncbi:MAG TPA: VOC family protein [Dehalococcoidia bacterium]|nr:VOC family protein [Dehalococcoidia bacterium]
MIKPTRLGHVVLRVRDLKRSEEFYTKFLGLEVKGRGGDRMVFFRSNEDTDHDLAISNVGADAPGPEANRVGMYHLAYEFDSIEDIKEAYRLTQELGVEIAGFGDHGEIKGLYVRDPDGIEIELCAFAPEYKDTPLEQLLTQGEPVKA